MVRHDYKARVFVVLMFFFALFSIVIIRLFLIQINQKEFFNVLARHQHQLSITINPPRAGIFDRTGKQLLAINREVPSLFILPHEFAHEKQIKAFLKRHFPEVYQRMEAHPEKHFLWLERKVTPERLKQIENYNIEDVQCIAESQRFYPHSSLAHIIGFTDIDNIGIAGVELAFSKQLGGTPTTLRLEKDARSGSFYFEKSIEKQGLQGQPVMLTIDGALQFFAFEELQKTVNEFGAKGGAVLIMNPDNGEVLTMANYPTFDANQKSVQAVEETKNAIVTECYEPGSVIKAFTALAAFEEGVVTPSEIIDCGGQIAYVDGVRVENCTIALLNALKESNNMLSFNDVIKYSCNVGTAKVATRLGPKMYEHLRKLGLGSKTNIEFPGERSGFVNPPDRWSRPSLIVLSFGYEIMASLLQLGRAFSVIANGGYEIEPTMLCQNLTQEINSKKLHKKLYKDSTIACMKEIMEQIGKKYGIDGYRVLGKTGTARCVKNGKYSRQDHNYMFVGIVEKDNYRRLVITHIREPLKANLWASETAAPLFRKIAEHMVIHDLITGAAKC